MIWNPFRARQERAYRRIAAVFLAHPEERHYGYPLTKQARVSSGALYPVLTRMEQNGFIASGSDKPTRPGIPSRRWYRLTALGRAALTVAGDTE